MKQQTSTCAGCEQQFIGAPGTEYCPRCALSNAFITDMAKVIYKHNQVIPADSIATCMLSMLARITEDIKVAWYLPAETAEQLETVLETIRVVCMSEHMH